MREVKQNRIRSEAQKLRVPDSDSIQKDPEKPHPEFSDLFSRKTQLYRGPPVLLRRNPSTPKPFSCLFLPREAGLGSFCGATLHYESAHSSAAGLLAFAN